MCRCFQDSWCFLGFLIMWDKKQSIVVSCSQACWSSPCCQEPLIHPLHSLLPNPPTFAPLPAPGPPLVSPTCFPPLLRLLKRLWLHTPLPPHCLRFSFEKGLQERFRIHLAPPIPAIPFPLPLVCKIILVAKYWVLLKYYKYLCVSACVYHYPNVYTICMSRHPYHAVETRLSGHLRPNKSVLKCQIWLSYS